MIKKVLISFATIAVAAASAATYKVNLLEPTLVNGQELKAGQYKVDVNGDKAVFHNGKRATEAPVKVETAGEKFKQTSFRYDRNPDGKMKLQEIKVGGSNTTLVFAE